MPDHARRGQTSNETHAMMPSMTIRPAATALFGAFCLALAPGLAEASPCCAGSTTPGFESLALWEKLAAGVRLGFDRGLGQWDAHGLWHPDDRYSESTLRGEFWLLERVADAWQLGLRLPATHLWRHAGDLSDDGGGIGDLGASARYDVYAGGEGPLGLGVALVGSLVAPTGRPTDQASGALGADVTGEGHFMPGLGVALMRPFGDAFVRLQTGLGVPLSRRIEGRDTRRGPDLQTSLVLGDAPVTSLTLSVSLSHRYEAATHVDGAALPQSARASLFAGAGLAWDLPAPVENLALQASCQLPLPLDRVGQNLIAGLGATLGLRVGWP